MLHALLPANRKTHKNITWWQPNHHSLSKWLTVCTRQDLGREHSIPQYVTLTLDVYQVCHAVSCWVIDGSCSSSSVERKANGQYCWDILISQQMLDDIKMILVTISVFQQDSALVHLAFNTAQLPQCKTQLPFSWATDDIILILQQNRLRWYRHVLRKEDTDRLKKCMEYEVEGSRPRGRPENMERGCAKILPST